MTDLKTFPLFVRRGLWFVIATVALTGLWLGLGALGKTAGPEPNGFGIWIVVAAVWLAFIAAMVGWAFISDSGTLRRRLKRAGGVLCADYVALVGIGIPVGFIGYFNRLCSPGSDVNAPASIAWLASAVVYYAIGYFGFTRPRRLWLIWPLAIACALVALLIVEFIWTTSSGCGD